MKTTVIVLIGMTLLFTACGTLPTKHDMSDMPITTTTSPSTHVHQSEAIAHFSVASKQYLPNEDASVTILIQNKWNKPIDKFDIMHEKLLHLIVVSKDLTYFDHLHPEYVGGGRFEIKTKFPAGGHYQLIADFTPQGMGETIQTHWVTINGQQKKEEKLLPDTNLTKRVGDKEVQNFPIQCAARSTAGGRISRGVGTLRPKPSQPRRRTVRQRPAFNDHAQLRHGRLPCTRKCNGVHVASFAARPIR